MALAASHRPYGDLRLRALTHRLRRVVTVAEFLAVVVVFGAVLGFAVGTGLADVLVLLLHHVDRVVGVSRAR